MDTRLVLAQFFGLCLKSLTDIGNASYKSDINNQVKKQVEIFIVKKKIFHSLLYSLESLISLRCSTVEASIRDILSSFLITLDTFSLNLS